MALYFASRGHGHADGTPYHSQARILLSGLGADELFGGYSRHRRAFECTRSDIPLDEKWESLAKEMEVDLVRIGQSNDNA